MTRRPGRPLNSSSLSHLFCEFTIYKGSEHKGRIAEVSCYQIIKQKATLEKWDCFATLTIILPEEVLRNFSKEYKLPTAKINMIRYAHRPAMIDWLVLNREPCIKIEWCVSVHSLITKQLFNWSFTQSSTAVNIFSPFQDGGCLYDVVAKNS